MNTGPDFVVTITGTSVVIPQLRCNVNSYINLFVSSTMSRMVTDSISRSIARCISSSRPSKTAWMFLPTGQS